MDWYIGSEWKSEAKGIRKVVLDLKFQKVAKPSELAKVKIRTENVKLDTHAPSKYLNAVGAFDFEMGTALTPLDFYIELLVQNMILGEKSQFFITTSSGQNITCVITLEEIISDKLLFQLDVAGMHDLALKYKENGVKIFKEYPIFAHDYFSRAAKCLISFKPFKDLTKKSNGMDGNDMELLLQNIQTNIAACLLQEGRFEHAIYVTNFVDSSERPTDKSIYRRSIAFYSIKEYDKAIKCIEKAPNFKEKKEFMRLYTKIQDNWKTDKENYKNVVQRMFTQLSSV